MFYLWIAFDSPFAFVTNHAAWEGGNGGIGHNFISALLLTGFFPFRFYIRNLPQVFDVGFFLLF
jgi:hypothetical protein